jgi:hypothetical protein
MEEEQTPFLVKACIFTRALCLPGSFLVFVLYWGLVFDGTIHLISVFTHGVNFIVMLIDTIINRQQLRMTHWLYFQCFTILYVIWTIIFYATMDRPCDCSNNDDEPEKYGCKEEGTGKNDDECRFIYGSVNWASASRSGTTILVCLLLFIAVPISFFIFYGYVIFIRKIAKNNDFNENENILLRQSTIEEMNDKGCKGVCQYEMKMERLSLSEPNWINNFKKSSRSGLSEFQFLIFRIVLFNFWFWIFIWSLTSQDFLDLYLIYITNWTLLVQLLYLFLGMLSTYFAQKKASSTMMVSSDDEDKL